MLGGGGEGGVNHCLISLCNHTNECKIQTTLDREIKPSSLILSKANQKFLTKKCKQASRMCCGCELCSKLGFDLSIVTVLLWMFT